MNIPPKGRPIIPAARDGAVEPSGGTEPGQIRLPGQNRLPGPAAAEGPALAGRSAAVEPVTGAAVAKPEVAGDPGGPSEQVASDPQDTSDTGDTEDIEDTGDTEDTGDPEDAGDTEDTDETEGTPDPGGHREPADASDQALSEPQGLTEPAVQAAITAGDAGQTPGPDRDSLGAAPAGPSEGTAHVWVLVHRAQRGDTDAFAMIYERYLSTVFRFIYFRVGNRPLAEDLTAEAFLRALRRIGSFTWQGRDIGAWLITIARNLVADHFKSGRHRLEVSTADLLAADRAERGPEGSPEAAVLDHITNVTLLRAVRQLNPEQQDCIVLRFLHGFSVAETAAAMGKNEGAIKALQYRAVRNLRRLLPDGFHL